MGDREGGVERNIHPRCVGVSVCMLCACFESHAAFHISGQLVAILGPSGCGMNPAATATHSHHTHTHTPTNTCARVRVHTRTQNTQTHIPTCHDTKRRESALTPVRLTPFTSLFTLYIHTSIHPYTNTSIHPGKSSLLDILAHRPKLGKVTGEIHVTNATEVNDADVSITSRKGGLNSSMRSNSSMIMG